MFYSTRIVLLTCLASFSGTQAQDMLQEQLTSFFKGVGPVACGMLLGYGTGTKIKKEIFCTFLGGAFGAFLDHYYCNGNDDKNKVARKLGNLFPLAVAAAVLVNTKNQAIPVTVGEKQTEDLKLSDQTLSAGEKQTKHLKLADKPYIPLIFDSAKENNVRWMNLVGEKNENGLHEYICVRMWRNMGDKKSQYYVGKYSLTEVDTIYYAYELSQDFR